MCVCVDKEGKDRFGGVEDSLQREHCLCPVRLLGEGGSGERHRVLFAEALRELNIKPHNHGTTLGPHILFLPKAERNHQQS